METFRQEAHKNIEPHRKRAFETERRADSDHRDIKPDAQIFRADETGVKQITQGHIDQNHHEQRGKDCCRDRTEYLVQNGQQPPCHTLRADAPSCRCRCGTRHHVFLLHSRSHAHEALAERSRSNNVDHVNCFAAETSRDTSRRGSTFSPKRKASSSNGMPDRIKVFTPAFL